MTYDALNILNILNILNSPQTEQNDTLYHTIYQVCVCVLFKKKQKLFPQLLSVTLGITHRPYDDANVTKERARIKQGEQTLPYYGSIRVQIFVYSSSIISEPQDLFLWTNEDDIPVSSKFVMASEP